MKFTLLFTLLLWILSSLFCNSASAQTFKHFTENEGAPYTTVFDIVQDKNGFMWYSTSMGLYRYDTKTFKRYFSIADDSSTLSNNYIKSLFCDSKGILWAGTIDGLNRYDRDSDTFTRFKHNPKDQNTIIDDNINDIKEDSQKRLWIATSQGLDMLKDVDKRVKIVHYLNNQGVALEQEVNKIAIADKGQLWLATKNGLLRMVLNGKIEGIFKANSDTRLPSLNDFNSIYSDNTGNLWLGSRMGGLARFNIKSGIFTVIDSFLDPNRNLPVISGFVPDKQDKVWIATQSGLAYFDLKTFQTIWYVNKPENHYSLSDNSLLAIYKDNQGGIWLGSYFQGIHYLNGKTSFFSNAPFFLNSSVPSVFLNGWMGITPTDKLWVIAEDKSQIMMFDKKTNKTTIHNLKLGFSLYSNHFFVDENDVVWYSGNRSLSSFAIKTGKLQDYKISYSTAPFPKKDRVYRMIQDSKGNLWLTGGFGLIRFDKEKENFHYTKIKEVSVCIFEDSKGNIWVGGKNKIWYLKGGSNNIQEVEIVKKEPSGSENILRIVEDAEGRIWHNTINSLKQYDKKSNKFINITPNGIDLQEFVDIQADNEGYLWLSLGTKLVRYLPKNGISQKYTYVDGLPQNGFMHTNSAVKDKQGYFYYTTNKNMFSFNPNNITPDAIEAPIVLSTLKLFNKEVNVKDKTGIIKKEISQEKELVFRHDQDIFTLDFALLSYSKSDQNQYSYMLEGFEKSWNDVKTPSATYTNLPSGKYTFLVKAANGDGNWNKSQLRVSIIILAPWWKTWYAYIGYVILVGLIISGINRFFWLRKTFRKENELYQAKLNFFTNISHEIRTHLSLISGPLQKASQSNITNSHTGSYINQAKTSSERLTNLVDELLDFRKIQSGSIQLKVASYDIVKILQNVLAAFEHILLEKGLNVETQFPKNPQYIWLDQSQIQKIFFNLLSNAIKFTPRGGKISIDVSESSHEMVIKIIDNGIGIAPKHLANLFTNFFQVYDNQTTNTGYGIGLALSKEIVNQHHGDLSVTSQQANEFNAGNTCFTLKLLKGKAHFKESEITESVIFNNNNLIKNIDYRINEDENRLIKFENTILLIEDNEELRSFMKDVLGDKFNILEAEDGVLGLEMARRNLPDLILCDIMMPVLDGFEVCKQLRSDANTQHIPLIFISAKSTITDMIDGLSLGADDYLVKPFDLKILEVKITNLIQVRNGLKTNNTKLILEPDGLPISDINGEFIIKLKNLIVENISNPNFGVNDMAFHMGTSVSVLYRKLRILTSMTVNDFVKVIRMKSALQLLESSSYNVNEVANAVGYEDAKYFSKEFRKTYGKNPNEIRKLKTV